MNYYFKALQNFANFNGRARRSEYWYFFLFNILFAIAIGFVDGFLGIGILGTVYWLVTLIPHFAVIIRRMHDVGKSGWYCLIPIYGFILLLTAGTRGPNEYGPDPKATA